MRLLNWKEASEVLHVSPHTIRRWRHQKKLPVIKLGRRVLFRKEDLEKLVDQNFHKQEIEL